MCGAGMSLESEIPGFTKIIEHLLYDYFGNEITKEEINHLSLKFRPEAIVAWYIENRDNGLDHLFRILNKILEPPEAEPHEGHHLLNGFFSENYIKRIYTTNFESLIEKEFGQAGRRITDLNLHKLDDIEGEGFIAIIHLHGHLKEKIKITEKATFEADSKCVSEFFMEFSKKDFIIFIGHSFNDDDIRQLVLRFITDEDIKPLDDKAGVSPQQVTPKRAKLVMVAPVSNDREKEVATGVWKSRGFIFIPMRASAFIRKSTKRRYTLLKKRMLSKNFLMRWG